MKSACRLCVMLCCLYNTAHAQNKKKITRGGTVTIIFRNYINNKPLILYDSLYTNSSGENYTISKLKYYVSNIQFYKSGRAVKRKGYYLINQAIGSSLSFNIRLPENDYDSIGFLLGVDSIQNVSGAQTGALDPLNDMFWTWRSGYVMEKLEGTSPQSTLVNNKWEYHIGGFQGENNVLNYITLPFIKEKNYS